MKVMDGRLRLTEGQFYSGSFIHLWAAVGPPNFVHSSDFRHEYDINDVFMSTPCRTCGGNMQVGDYRCFGGQCFSCGSPILEEGKK